MPQKQSFSFSETGRRRRHNNTGAILCAVSNGSRFLAVSFPQFAPWATNMPSAPQTLKMGCPRLAFSGQPKVKNGSLYHRAEAESQGFSSASSSEAELH